MSKRRLVITAVLAGQSQSEVARTYGVAQGWISRILARYRVEAEVAFEPRLRAPQSSPGATPPQTVELVLQLRKQLGEAGLDAGADTIGWHLAHHHATALSRATINRILVRAGATLMNRLLTHMLQALIEAEASAHIGASRHERAQGRLTQRNGYRDKTLATATGDVAVRSPRPAPGRSSRACSGRAGESTGRCTR